MRKLIVMLLAPLVAAPTLAQLPPPTPPANPPANCTAPEHRQFDFWIGEWRVFQTQRPEEQVAVSTIEGVFNGCGIRETWQPFTLHTGGSLSNFDPVSGRWHQLWIGSVPGHVMFEGGLVDGQMVLTGYWRNVNGPGQHGLIRMTFSANADGSVRQLGEVSTDHGLTWAPSFDFLYRRRNE